MSEPSLTWERLVPSPLDAPPLWRTPVPGGWLVCGRAGAPVWIADSDRRWLPSQAPAEPGSEPVERDDAVVDNPMPGVETTSAELAVFHKIKAWADEERDALGLGDRTLGYLDTTSYFVVHAGSPTRWIARVAFGARASWLGLCIDEEEARAVMPDAAYEEPTFVAPTRLTIRTPQDLDALRPLVRLALRKRA